MTCIVAIAEKDKIWMGCDTLITVGTHAVAGDTKIVKKENMIMGFSGRARDINLIRFGFEIPAHPKDIDDYEYMATIFTTAVRERLKDFGAAKKESGQDLGGAYILIGYRDKLYEMHRDFCLLRIEDINYCASGSGKSLAFGSLFSTQDTLLNPEERLLKALEAAEEFVTSVRGPFVIECLEA